MSDFGTNRQKCCRSGTEAVEDARENFRRLRAGKCIPAIKSEKRYATYTLPDSLLA